MKETEGKINEKETGNVFKEEIEKEAEGMGRGEESSKACGQ